MHQPGTGRGEAKEAAPGTSPLLGLWVLHTQPHEPIPGGEAQGLEPGERRLWISEPARGRPPHLRSKPLARLLGAVTVAGRPVVDKTLPAAHRLSPQPRDPSVRALTLQGHRLLEARENSAVYV